MFFKSFQILIILTVILTQTSYSGEKKKETEIKSKEVKSTKITNKVKIKEDKEISNQKDTYVSFKELSNGLLNKLKDKQYEDVENYFNKIISSKEKTKDGIHLSWEIYDNLADNYNNSEIDIFNAWCNSTSHHSAFVVRGIYHINDAWRVRGSNYSRYVTDENFSLFRERLTLALNDLEKAYQLKPDDPNISTHMLTVIRGLGLSDNIREIWFKRGQDADSSFYWLYDKKLTSLYPKWGGSWEELYSFALSLYSDPPKESLAYTLMLNVIFEALTYSEIRNKFKGYEDIEKYIRDIEIKYHLEFPEGNFITIKKERIRGFISFMKNRNREAELSFKKIVELDPEYHWAWAMLGQMYYKHLNKPNEALEYFNKAIELNDDEGIYYNERGYAAKMAKQYELCVHDISRGIEMGYSTDFDFQVRAACYRKLKQYESAMHDYSTILERNPNNQSTYMARAMCYREQNDVQSALEDYSKAINLDPKNIAYLKLRATLYYENNMHDNFKSDVKRILEIDPNNAWARSELQKYQ